MAGFNLKQFENIRTFIFDVDGVMTDGRLYLLDGKQPTRRMNIRDGYALQLAIKKGYHIIIISGGSSPEVLARLNTLGIKEVYLGIRDKVDKLEDLKLEHDLDLENTLYMGDDMPDYEVMQLVGMPTCPDNAAPEIINISKYISPVKGGNGCVRDVIEKVLKIRGDWR